MPPGTAGGVRYFAGPVSCRDAACLFAGGYFRRKAAMHPSVRFAVSSPYRGAEKRNAPRGRRAHSDYYSLK